jgi:hypothetical protein
LGTLFNRFSRFRKQPLIGKNYLHRLAGLAKSSIKRHEQASTQLIFTSDKEKYNVNDNVTISFPEVKTDELYFARNSKGLVDYKW